MPRVLIAGCGYVGTATANLFQQSGWQVEGWTSSAESARELTEMPFPVRAVNISESKAVANAGGDFDAIISCASSRGGGADDYRRIYLEGARNLAASFSRSLLVFTSSTSVYAQKKGEWVAEESEAEPEAQTGRVLRETERFVLGNGGIVARLAGIYGPGRSALLRKFLAGEDGGPNLDHFINQVHRDDVAAALCFLTRAGLEGSLAPNASQARIFNVTDNHPISRRECFAWLASHLPPPRARTNAAATRRRRGSSNKRVSSAKLQALGWAPRFATFEAGMTQSVLPHAGLEPSAS